MNIDRIKLVVMDVDGSLTDGGIYISEQGEAFKKFDARDGLAIGILEKNGIKTAFLSHAKTPKIVEKRAEMLGISFCYAGNAPKSEILQGWIDELGITAEEVFYYGDDLNDMDVMHMAGIVACPQSATYQVKLKADYVCEKSSGDAAFREAAEYFWPHLFGL